MKHIVVFGAGKSATCLIEYLISTVQVNHWQLTVADNNLALAQSKTEGAAHTKAIAIDVESVQERETLIATADIVISLLPPALHYLVATACVELGKDLLTASYVDDRMRQLAPQVEKKGLLFLCEMGLDPGIDHMSAMQLIHRIKEAGGHITSFNSHCGGLVAPESDNNPWRYKISWNPRNVVLAGKAGAIYRENNAEVHQPYEELFDPNRIVEIPSLGPLAWYPNRDSLSYLPVYGLEDATTFIRTTLRYPEFCFGWKNIIALKLTDETPQYESDGLSLQQFFQQHFSQYGFSDWIKEQLTTRFEQTKQLLEKLQQLLEAEEEVDEKDRAALQEFMMVDDQGKLMDFNLDKVKTQTAATVAGQMHEANLSMKQLFFLGMDDDDTVINKGLCSAADALQLALEKKLVLNDEDKDMIVMLHEIGWETAAGFRQQVKSSLIVKGEDHLRTAMAKTVGLPLGIAAKLILQGKLSLTGLHIPILPEIYEPVLEALKEQGISFVETA